MKTCVDCGCEIRADAERCVEHFKAHRAADIVAYLPA